MEGSTEQTQATAAAEGAAGEAEQAGASEAGVKAEATKAAKAAAPKLSPDEHKAIGSSAAAAVIEALREEGALVSEDETSRGVEQPAQSPPPSPAPASASPAAQPEPPPQKRNFAQRFLKD